MTENRITTVSLVMPMFNEAVDLSDVLASLDAQRYPHEALYLILVDGGSTDGSADIARKWFERTDIAGEIVGNPRRTIPKALNIGIARARAGDVVVRLDAHTTYDPGYVETIVNALAALPDTVACVGGAQSPADERTFGRSVVRALYLNPMGLGGAGFRRASNATVVPAVYLGAWRPGVLARVGGYDERWEANEDGEMAARMRESGYQTMWIPLKSAYRVKRGPIAAIKQWGRYGFWRAQTILRHPGELRLRHLLPPVALIATIALAFSPLRIAVVVFYALYASAIYAHRSRAESPLVTLATCVFFPACQVAWSLGLLRGFATLGAAVRSRGHRSYG